jgi:type VI secretion system ImpC/EvpB family protein/type VI secretion system ImpB/VipA family protein
MTSTDHKPKGQDIDSLSKSQGWPLRLVIFGEFQPGKDSGRKPSQGSQAYAIDKDSFDEVLSKVAGDLLLEMPNSGIYSFEKQWIRLPLRNMRSFHPANVAEAIPELSELLTLRKRVTELANGKLSFDEFQSQVKGLRGGTRILGQLRPSTPLPMQKSKNGQTNRKEPTHGRRASTQADEIVDSILGIVDLPDSASGPAIPQEISEIGKLIAEIGGSGPSGGQSKPGKAREIILELDKILSSGVERILHHPEFRRLESLWRGLKFLVDRTDFREPISIEIRVCSKEDLPDSLITFVNQIESQGGLDSDVVVLIACEFDKSPKDIKVLRQLAETAENLQVPVISSVGLSFFGFESARDFERSSFLGAIFNQKEYAKWRSLREAESSRWLTLLFNRFLLRYPYGRDRIRVKAFDFTETLPASPTAAYLWGNPVWGIASLLTKQFAATGNCLDFTGWQRGLIQDIPIREVQIQSGVVVQCPLEVNISEDSLADLTKGGIAVLVSRINTDSAAVLSAPTVHLPERYSDEEETRRTRLRASLPYQLFVSRIVVCAQRLAGSIVPGLAPDTAGTLIKEILAGFVPGRSDPDAVEVSVSENERHPEYYDVNLTLRPDQAGWNFPPIQMQLRVNR